jgi:hypothetical protein
VRQNPSLLRRGRGELYEIEKILTGKHLLLLILMSVANYIPFRMGICYEFYSFSKPKKNDLK